MVFLASPIRTYGSTLLGSTNGSEGLIGSARDCGTDCPVDALEVGRSVFTLELLRDVGASIRNVEATLLSTLMATIERPEVELPVFLLFLDRVFLLTGSTVDEDEATLFLLVGTVWLMVED